MYIQSMLTRAALAFGLLVSLAPVMLADGPSANRMAPPGSGRNAPPGSGKVVWANEEAPESVAEEAVPAEEEAR